MTESLPLSDEALENALALSRAVFRLLETWGVSPSDQIALLKLPEDVSTRHLRRYVHDTPLPDTREVQERLEHIIGIADALRTTFPTNPNMGELWMRKRNRHFRRRTPVAAMVEDGDMGVIKVRSHLDCSYAWADSGSTASARS